VHDFDTPGDCPEGLAASGGEDTLEEFETNDS